MNFRFVVAIVLVCLAFILSVGGCVLTKQIETKLLLQTQNICGFQAENDLSKRVNELNEVWHQYEMILSLMLNRRECEQLDVLIAQLIAYGENGDAGAVSVAAEQLCAVLEDMLNAEKISLYNLF